VITKQRESLEVFGGHEKEARAKEEGWRGVGLASGHEEPKPLRSPRAVNIFYFGIEIGGGGIKAQENSKRNQRSV